MNRPAIPPHRATFHWLCIVLASCFFVWPSPLMAKRFSTGLVQEDPAVLAALPKAPHFRAFLSPTMDLSQRLPPIRSQGNQGSCTAWATGYYLRSYYQIIQGNKTLVPFSPAYIFNQIKLGEGCDQGSRISDALRLMQENGAVPWASFPYSDDTCAQQPDTSQQAQAAQYKIAGFKRLNEHNIDDIRGALAQGHPVVFGMMVDDAFQYEKGMTVLQRDMNCAECGGHAMTLVGYDDARSAFRVVNSWGDDWGDHGFFWLGYDAFATNTHAALRADMEFDPLKAVNAIKRRVEPEPAPIPKPEPAPIPKPEPAPIPKPEPAPEPEPIPEPAPVLDQSKVAQRLAILNCATVHASYPKENSLHLEGFVASEADRQRLQTQLHSLAGLEALSMNVAVRPWPQCEALQTFAAALATPHGLQARIPDNASPAQLNEGDYLTLEVTTPDFPAYIYVTYLQAGGDAVQLHRPFWLDPPTPANTTITLGVNPKKVRFKIQPPFGSEMMMVMASEHPLFERQQPVVEEERQYLTAFRRRVLHLQQTFPHQRVAAHFFELNTHAKE